MITATQANPTCPYCLCTKTTMDVIDYFCPQCGAEFDRSTSIRMLSLPPEIRAGRIGDYHARNSWAYLWCVPEFTREELRAYARGFLSVAYTSRPDVEWLYGDVARKDAHWRD